MSNKPGFMTIAIDGGAASGKSTTARALAARYHWLHVDTGSHYRVVTRALLNAGITPDNPEAVSAHLTRLMPDTQVEGNQARLILDREDFPAESLRTEAVNSAVSRFAAMDTVRAFLLHYQRHQRQVAQEHGFNGLVMEGRDIGSIIFPDAELRIFLEADPATRAQRRADEGQVDSVSARDALDTTRKNAPLVCPAGALKLDTACYSVDEILAQIDQHVTAWQNRPTP
jgi:cytidylate kinase